MRRSIITLALWLVTCAGGDPRPADMGGSGPGPTDCGGCPDGKVCSGGACVDLPSSCPCPKESYCDLAEQRCKAGCTEDSHCEAGRVCETASRSCRAGCRLDADCASGSYCDSERAVCRRGLRVDFAACQLTLTGAMRSGVVRVGDVDGDRKLDALTYRHFDAKMGRLLGKGDGTFTALSPLSFSGVLALALGDLSGDGKADRVMLISQELRVATSNGDGSFTSVTPAASVYGTPDRLLLPDLNGDGKLDVMISYNDTVRPEMSVLLGKGDGTLSAEVRLRPCTGHARHAQAGDVNGDGRLDVVAACAELPESVAVLLGKGDGSFQAPVRQSATWRLGGDLALADMNGDGKADLVGFSDQSWAMTALSKGDGTFADPVQSALGSPLSALTVADVNQDGVPDLLTTREDSSAVQVLIGRSDGSFAASRQVSMGAGITSLGVDLIAADADADGRPDLLMVVTPGSGNSVCVMKNTSR